MAAYTGTESIPAIPSGIATSTGLLTTVQGTQSIPSGGGGIITTYYYRTALGVRGSTTNVGSIPVGSVIERIVTT
jgi:hypothetical protein